MRPRHGVIWAEVAENDLKDLIGYIALDNPPTALEILAKIKQKAASLYTLPEQGRLVPEFQDQGIQIYRELIILPWRMIYRTAERIITVLAVLDGRRNIEDILLKRLI